jgi:hypothetical protein
MATIKTNKNNKQARLEAGTHFGEAFPLQQIDRRQKKAHPKAHPFFITTLKNYYLALNTPM